MIRRVVDPLPIEREKHGKYSVGRLQPTAYKVTCVAFTGRLGQAKAAEIQESIDEVMRNAEPIYAAPPGTIIKLGMDYAKGNVKRYALRVGNISLGAFIESLPSN